MLYRALLSLAWRAQALFASFFSTARFALSNSLSLITLFSLPLEVSQETASGTSTHGQTKGQGSRSASRSTASARMQSNNECNRQGAVDCREALRVRRPTAENLVRRRSSSCRRGSISGLLWSGIQVRTRYITVAGIRHSLLSLDGGAMVKTSHSHTIVLAGT